MERPLTTAVGTKWPGSDVQYANQQRCTYQLTIYNTKTVGSEHLLGDTCKPYRKSGSGGAATECAVVHLFT